MRCCAARWFAGTEWGNKEFWIEFVIFVLFVADMVLSFFTTQMRGGKEIFRLHTIARSYVFGKDPGKFRLGWFFVDLISLAPDAMSYFPLIVGPYQTNRHASLTKNVPCAPSKARLHATS
jgi:hypothetical protein